MVQYISKAGIVNHMDDDVTSDLFEMVRLDIIYAQKAKAESVWKGCDIFYCLKLKDKGKGIYMQANYFLIPIMREEVEQIIQLYDKTHFIGIMYLNQ